jgi:REP element-mobilizing transposase RayT
MSSWDKVPQRLFFTQRLFIDSKEGKITSMSTRPREVSSLGIYHVIYRGVGKQRIFEEDDDYGKFLAVLQKYQPICGYKILAYCLMSNHIHLLIKPDEMPMSRIFQRVIPSFVYWYNKKYERVGSLFQSRFKSRPVNNSNQLLTVIRYIHQNPIKAAICDHPAQYQYSSYKDYFDNDLIDSSIVRSIVNDAFFLSFNCAENDDQCMDIDDERPRMKDERAANIMQRLSGCSNVTQFQQLDVKVRDEVLYDMWSAGVSVSQASRVTGISYGVIRRVIASAGRK